MLDLRQFAVLHAIRAGGSLSRAAAELRLSVPTVTHHLDALERHLGARLVTRGPRGASLTALGAMFADDVDDVLGRLELATRKVDDAREAGAVTLRIGTFSSAGSRLLPEALNQLSAATPVFLEIEEGEPTSLAGKVRAGELHAALVYDLEDDPALDHPELTRQELDIEPLTVITAAGSELADQSVDFAELASQPWIRSRDRAGAAERQLVRLAAAAGFHPRTLTRTDDYTMVHGLVAGELGLALISSASIDPRFAVAAVRVQQPLGARRIAYVTPADRPTPASLRLGEILARHTSLDQL
jgi:Transcriptional regulator